ncbi:MAG: hypothetical protein KJ043_13700, partial [Anaerolineae bacterium]|nr:hypothetical protein [Anaerolineae bacterium]
EVIVRALMGLTRLNMAQHSNDDMTEWLDEAQTRADATYSRRLIGDVYALKSRYYANKGNLERANESWQKASAIYRLLGLPMSDAQPTWLAG